MAFTRKWRNQRTTRAAAVAAAIASAGALGATAPTPAAAQSPAPAAKPASPLTITAERVPTDVKTGRWVTVRLRVANNGTKTAKKVNVSVRKRAGVSVRPSKVTIKKSIRPGKSRVAKLRVQLRRGAADYVTLRARAKASKTRAAESSFLFGNAGPFAGRYMWGFRSSSTQAWDNYGVYFSSPKFAYYGFPDGPLPDCTKAEEKLDDNGAPTGEGCFPLSYDAKSGKVTVGPYEGDYTKGQLTLDGVVMRDLQIPEPGTRLHTQLEHRGFRGLCGLFLGCTTWHYELALGSDGAFVRTSSSITSFGGVGSQPYVWAAGFPPDQHGTYEIIAGGAIRMSYADGSVKTLPIGIELSDQGRPDPVGEGLLLGENNYYPPSS